MNDVSRYHLLVEGYGLAAVMGAPGIDGTRTRSNHIIEVRLHMLFRIIMIFCVALSGLAELTTAVPTVSNIQSPITV